jgi:hypothetical protein
VSDIYRWIVSVLVWLSADPAAIDAERPKAAAAVAAARASLAVEAPAPTPDNPQPTPAKCCGECGGTGYLTMPDGHRVKCPCPADCPCLKKPTTPKPAPPACPDGKCPVPGASPAAAAPARPAGGR